MPRFYAPRNTSKKSHSDSEVITKSAAARFNASLLGIGDITQESNPTRALVAIFDLEGFTRFCSQIEPQLSTPKFLSRFIEWIILKIKQEAIDRKTKTRATLWHRLPFFLKFLGDGILVIWETVGMDETDLNNIVVSMEGICVEYVDELLPEFKKQFSDPPCRLRCGIAQGIVFSVGDGSDYIGTPINMAARLQKLPGISFAVSKRGFDLSEADESFRKEIKLKKVELRGIGDSELVYVLKNEYKSLPKDQKAFFKKV